LHTHSPRFTFTLVSLWLHSFWLVPTPHTHWILRLHYVFSHYGSGLHVVHLVPVTRLAFTPLLRFTFTLDGLVPHVCWLRLRLRFGSRSRLRLRLRLPFATHGSGSAHYTRFTTVLHTTQGCIYVYTLPHTHTHLLVPRYQLGLHITGCTLRFTRLPGSAHRLPTYILHTLHTGSTWFCTTGCGYARSYARTRRYCALPLFLLPFTGLVPTGLPHSFAVTLHTFAVTFAFRICLLVWFWLPAFAPTGYTPFARTHTTLYRTHTGLRFRTLAFPRLGLVRFVVVYTGCATLPTHPHSLFTHTQRFWLHTLFSSLTRPYTHAHTFSLHTTFWLVWVAPRLVWFTHLFWTVWFWLVYTRLRSRVYVWFTLGHARSHFTPLWFTRFTTRTTPLYRLLRVLHAAFRCTPPHLWVYRRFGLVAAQVLGHTHARLFWFCWLHRLGLPHTTAPHTLPVPLLPRFGFARLRLHHTCCGFTFTVWFAHRTHRAHFTPRRCPLVPPRARCPRFGLVLVFTRFAWVPRLVAVHLVRLQVCTAFAARCVAAAAHTHVTHTCYTYWFGYGYHCVHGSFTHGSHTTHVTVTRFTAPHTTHGLHTRVHTLHTVTHTRLRFTFGLLHHARGLPRFGLRCLRFGWFTFTFGFWLLVGSAHVGYITFGLRVIRLQLVAHTLLVYGLRLPTRVYVWFPPHHVTGWLRLLRVLVGYWFTLRFTFTTLWLVCAHLRFTHHGLRARLRSRCGYVHGLVGTYTRFPTHAHVHVHTFCVTHTVHARLVGYGWFGYLWFYIGLPTTHYTLHTHTHTPQFTQFWFITHTGTLWFPHYTFGSTQFTTTSFYTHTRSLRLVYTHLVARLHGYVYTFGCFTHTLPHIAHTTTHTRTLHTATHTVTRFVGSTRFAAVWFTLQVYVVWFPFGSLHGLV